MYNTLYIGLISLCLYHACITLSSVLGQCVFVMHCILLYVESGRRSRIGVYLSCVVTSMFSVGQGLGSVCIYHVLYTLCVHFQVWEEVAVYPPPVPLAVLLHRLASSVAVLQASKALDKGGLLSNMT